MFFSLDNSKFVDYVYCVFPIELKIRDTTETERSASNLDLHQKIDNNKSLRKRENFDFSFISRNIPATPAYKVYFISQLIPSSRACLPSVFY